ncbi:secretion protein SctD [Paraburkholderia acidipaludis]|uniref:secretion protein SctD n=1 Tax=Paraburkholderia acidipaludis TaxID=660537 RepID=UPI000489A2C2|nr:secretion protein SctD [Paraburkholderia acidipaludis]
MKALRVLTGAHAGAQVRLAAGTWRIAGDENADICISDWAVEELELCIGEDGVTRLRSHNGDEVLVADFVAVPFGDVVFCVGPDDAEWPRDLDLLSGLWKTAEPEVEANAKPAVPAGDAADEDAEEAPLAADSAPLHAARAGAQTGMQTAAPAPRRMTWRTAAVALACTAAIGGLATTGVMLAGTQPSEAANMRFDPDTLAREVDGELHREGLADLHAIARRNSVAVDGIVSTAGDGAKAQRIIDGLAPGKVQKDYDVAQEDVDNIQQSLAGTGAAVSYSGHGVFKVSGRVQSMATFQTLIAGVRADLDDNVRRVDIDVKESPTPAPDTEYTEVVATGGLRYVETPDGTKHLFSGN